MSHKGRNILCSVRSLIIPRMKQLYEYPLRPSVISWVRGSNLSVPIKRKAYFFKLLFVSIDVFLSGHRRMLPCLNRILFSRKPKAVIAHRMKDIIPLVSFESSINITRNIPQRMPHMKPRPRWIREHI